MRKYFRHYARPVALVPSLDEPGAQAQLWSDDAHVALVHVPAGALVAQASFVLDMAYERLRKEAAGLAKRTVASIDTLKPEHLKAAQVKDYYDTGAIHFADMDYMFCERSSDGRNSWTSGMVPKSTAAHEGRITLLFVLKRGLRRGEWGSIDTTLNEPDRQALKKYGERHWLRTWGLSIAITVIVIVTTWVVVMFQRR